MNHPSLLNHRPLAAAIVLALATLATPVNAAEEFDETMVRIEVNASDGDVGFHALLDATAWRWLRLDDPNGNKIFSVKPKGALREQGVTEEFFESSEPLCVADPEEPDERTQSLAEFLLLFAAGDYTARGLTIDNEKLKGEAELTWNIPAAPDISMSEDTTMAVSNAVLEWAPGDDLGDGGCHDQTLIDEGIIPDHAGVEVVRWEVVVEPAEDFDLERKFTAQLPPDQLQVAIPEEFLQSYLDQGITEMKFEIGGMEESGNQTFSEGEFEIE